MFETSYPPDKFRYLGWVVAALLLALPIMIFVVRPIQQARYMAQHPEFYGWRDSTKCGGHATPSPDRKYIVYTDNPCLYSPYGTVVAIYGANEPEGYGTYQTANAVLNMKSGGPVYVTWRTNRELVIVCRHCREQDAWFVKRQFRHLSVTVSFEGYGEPLPEYITGKR
jgi:hypothetical protein